MAVHCVPEETKFIYTKTSYISIAWGQAESINFAFTYCLCFIEQLIYYGFLFKDVID